MQLSKTGVRGFSASLFLTLAAAVVILVMVVGPASGADHRDSPAAEGAPAQDITDVYAFRSPENNDNLVVAFGVNGLTTPDQNDSAAFSSSASYQLHVDGNGDLMDDATVTWSFDSGDPQTFTITGLGDDITGEVTPAGDDPVVTDAGGIRAFAGLRDDPFFFDLVGFQSFVSGPYVPAAGLRADGDGDPADTFAGTNVSYMVLELPITAVTGAGDSNTGTIGAWVSAGTGSQLDRMAIPAVNTAVIPSAEKDAFNAATPAGDVANYQDTAETRIQGLRDAVNGALDDPVGEEDGGPFGELTSEAVAGILIPDIVTIDFSQSVAFPNGRQLEDDVIDVALQLVLNRTVGVTDAIDGNDKSFSNSFPYLAEPFVADATMTPGSVPSTGGQPGTDSSVNTWLIVAIGALGIGLLAMGSSLVLGRRTNR